jgi:hypothetical protein
MEGLLLHLQQRDRFWLPTLNLYQWMGKKSEERSSSGVKQEKEVPMGFLANAVNVIIRNTTELITTQYYFVYWRSICTFQTW